MKLTKKQIETIIENTPKALKGQHPSFDNDFGYYMPSNANWAYRAGWIRYRDGFALVVKVFGIVQ